MLQARRAAGELAVGCFEQVLELHINALLRVTIPVELFQPTLVVRRPPRSTGEIADLFVERVEQAEQLGLSLALCGGQRTKRTSRQIVQ